MRIREDSLSRAGVHTISGSEPSVAELIPGTRPHSVRPSRGGLNLEIPELRDLVTSLAADPRAWSHLVRHDASQRVFEPLIDEPEVEVWLICWMPGHDTGFHDHDLSSGAVAVVSGAVCEERLGLGQTSSNVYVPGDTFDFTASEIHRVTHAGAAATVTLHAYSPRLRRMGAYAVGSDGGLKRHPLNYGEELRPLDVSEPRATSL